MKKDNLNNIELRSLGVQSLLDKHPHWLILKGNFLISIILIFFLLILGFFVRYPEFVKSKIVIDSYKSQTTSAIGKLLLSKDDIGKVKVGQKVIIKLYDFPYQEFGILQGKVKQISSTGNGSWIDIVFPNGLRTSYNKELSCNKELKGNAEIVSQEMNLIEKFISKIKLLKSKYEN